MITKFGLFTFLVLIAVFLAVTAQAGAQTPTPTPAPPKAATGPTGATGTPAVAPPKAAAPAPAKTGNAGLNADATPPNVAAAPPADVRTLGLLAGLVTSLVAIVKGLYPGTIPSKWEPLLVAGVAVGVLALAVGSGKVGGSPLDLVEQAVALLIGAMGLREGVTAASFGFAGTLPTRGA